MHFSIDRTVHTTAFDKPVVDHWLERKIAQTAAGSTEKDRSDDRPLQRRARYRLSYIPLFTFVYGALNTFLSPVTSPLTRKLRYTVHETHTILLGHTPNNSEENMQYLTKKAQQKGRKEGRKYF